jgi:hypothetical protein
MNLTFTNESDFDALAFASTIQDILANETFECQISQVNEEHYSDYFELDLVIVLESKKLRVANCFHAVHNSSMKTIWRDKNDEQFSCASTFWRYVASNAKEIKP